jgi:hypothetical protein
MTSTVAGVAGAAAERMVRIGLADPGRAQPSAARLREGRFQARARSAYSLLGWLLAAAATVLAATGQIEFAISADIIDLRRFLVPAILEIAVIFVLLGGYLRACDGDTPALMWLLAAAITSFATWTNLEHGGPRAGRIFAAATVLTFTLWLLKLRDRYRAARRAAGLLDAPTAKFRLIRWIVMPRLTGRAWLIAVEYSLRDADEALRRARLWRDTFVDTRQAITGSGWWARRRAARRAAELAVRAAHVTLPAAGRASADVPAVAAYASAGRASTPVPDGQPTAPAAPTGPPLAVLDALAGQPPMKARAALVPKADAGHQPDMAGTGSLGAMAAPRDSAGHGAYTPTGDEDTVMYQAWCRAVALGQEPSGVDLARAAGRANDATGVGRRAARRYRDAHAAPPQTAAATAAPPVAAVAAVPHHHDRATPTPRHNGHTPTLTAATR